MRPLPRLHAITDGAVLALPDFALRAAGIASLGSGAALHARDHAATARRLVEVTERLRSLASVTEASVFVNGRADVAAALGCQGAQLRSGDLTPEEVRRAFGHTWSGWIGVSVHSAAEAEAAGLAGADYLLAGSIFPTPTHPDRTAAGIALVRQAAATGLPVIAIGGVTPEHVEELRAAGAYGVAAIRALWHVADSGEAGRLLLAPWAEAA